MASSKPSTMSARIGSLLAFGLILQVRGILRTTASGALPNWNNPVQSAAEDEIVSLPGLNDAINFRQFSGYLKASADGADPTQYYHYWLTESQIAPDKDPLMVWLNGGPGCSSLAGLLTEIGPFKVAEDGKTLVLRYNSWNKLANVLFIEAPTEVGFSYSTSGTRDGHTDVATADELFTAMRSFLTKFPQYKGRDVYLVGESYGAIFAATLGLRFIQLEQDLRPSLKGLAFGNAYIDGQGLASSLPFFAYYHGLLGKSIWDRVSYNCCASKPPSRENCILSGPKIGDPCRTIMNEIGEIITSQGLNPYNVYADCEHSNSSGSSREIVESQLMANAMKSSTRQVTQMNGLDNSITCIDEHRLVQYLNRPEVRAALHIPQKVASWDVCTELEYTMQYSNNPDAAQDLIALIVSGKLSLKTLFYNGDVDMVSNFMGNEWFVDELQWGPLSKDYEPWKLNKQVAGFTKRYQNLTYATIRGAGHMAPSDKPRETFEMMKMHLSPTGYIHSLCDNRETKC